MVRKAAPVMSTSQVDHGLATIAHLQHIRCVNVGARIVDPDALAGASIPGEVNIRARSAIADDGTLVFVMAYSIPLAKDEHVGATVSCEFHAVYAIPGDYRPTEKDVNDFTVEVVMPTLHPYVRETVSNMFARIGISVPLIGHLQTAQATVAADTDS